MNLFSRFRNPVKPAPLLRTVEGLVDAAPLHPNSRAKLKVPLVELLKLSRIIPSWNGWRGSGSQRQNKRLDKKPVHDEVVRPD